MQYHVKVTILVHYDRVLFRNDLFRTGDQEVIKFNKRLKQKHLFVWAPLKYSMRLSLLIQQTVLESGWTRVILNSPPCPNPTIYVVFACYIQRARKCVFRVRDSFPSQYFQNLRFDVSFQNDLISRVQPSNIFSTWKFGTWYLDHALSMRWIYKVLKNFLESNYTAYFLSITLILDVAIFSNWNSIERAVSYISSSVALALIGSWHLQRKTPKLKVFALDSRRF